MIRTGIARLPGFLEAEHILYRTTESDNPTGLGVSLPADDMSGTMAGTSRRSSRVASLLLQFRQASQATEIRTRGPDTGHAGRISLQTTQLQGGIHG